MNTFETQRTLDTIYKAFSTRNLAQAAGQLQQIYSAKYIIPIKGEAKIDSDLERQGITLLKMTP